MQSPASTSPDNSIGLTPDTGSANSASPNTDPKPWWQSKTILGIVIALLPRLLHRQLALAQIVPTCPKHKSNPCNHHPKYNDFAHSESISFRPNENQTNTNSLDAIASRCLAQVELC